MTRNDWHEVAERKLTKVLGPEEGQRALTQALEAIELQRIDSASDLARFAKELARRGGFASAVAAMLDVHAAMYGQ